MSSVPRLKYSIARFTSEDPEFPVSGLLAPHNSQSKGWQTARFCDFPQEIFLHFETPVHLRKVEFLSHQSKIATKIELFTALPNEGQECVIDNLSFKRLGYLSLDNNERSKFEARELKSVYVDVVAQCLRILFHKCHVNKYNIVNQVGLIALKCMGEVLGPDLALGQPQPNPALARGPVAVPAKAPSPAAQTAQDAAQDASDEMRFDARTLERIRALTTAKQRAVEAEDYEEAKRCKQMLARLRQTGLLLRELEDRKRSAVQNEDYDAAKALKVEIERLLVSIERPQAMEDDVSGPVSRGSPADHGHPPDQGDLQNHDWPAAPPPQMGQPRGMQHSRNEPPPQPFGGVEMLGPGRPHAGQPAIPEQAPFGRADSPIGGSFGGGDGSGFDGGRGMSPVHNYGQPQMFDPMPPREGLGSPPVPAASGGGNRLAHSPVGGVPPWGPSAGSALPPPEQPVQREQSNNFDPASHPLVGVPNVEDLGQPDQLPADKEVDALVALFGEYLIRCLYSKSWNLRDAALQKVVIDLNGGIYANTNPSQLLGGVAAILRRAIPDKNVQVFLACGPLLQSLCHGLLATSSLRRPEVHSALEPVMPMLAERLGDANARVDKIARDAHVDFAQSASVGSPFAAAHVLRPPKKKVVPPRVYTCRLQLLAALVDEAGIAPDQREGLDLEPIVKIAMEWFNNSNADVRESAVRLVGSCFAHVGLDRIEPYLAKLKPVQRELFDAEFDRRSNDEPEPISARARAGGGARDQTSLPNGGGGAVWGEMPAPQVPPPRGATGVGEASADVDETACQFCLRQDSTFTPETVDVHYWRECPMLIQCDFCQQVIEIATLHEHYANECESGAPARSKASELAPGSCVLCGIGVGAGEDEDWRDHLIRDGCRNNPRDANRLSG